MTVKDIEAKKITLETTLTTALAAAKTLEPATAEFDEAYGRYLSAKAALAKIPDEIASAKLAENADAIKTSSIAVAEAIEQVLAGLKVSELLGKPVESLRYFNTASKDEAGNEMRSKGVVFNPVVIVKGVGAGTKAAKGEAKAAGGHTMIVSPDGSKLSLTKFVMTHATEAEKASAEYKYPHTRVDSKPKFEEFCTAHALSGYIYETPSKAQAQESAS